MSTDPYLRTPGAVVHVDSEGVTIGSPASGAAPHLTREELDTVRDMAERAYKRTLPLHIGDVLSIAQDMAQWSRRDRQGNPTVWLYSVQRVRDTDTYAVQWATARSDAAWYAITVGAWLDARDEMWRMEV